MKIVWLELYKIFKTRIFLVLLLVLLLANSLLCYDTTQKYIYNGIDSYVDSSFWESVEHLCKIYNEDPEKYNQMFEDHEKSTFDRLQQAYQDPNVVYDPSWAPTTIDGKHSDSVLYRYANSLIYTEYLSYLYIL